MMDEHPANESQPATTASLVGWALLGLVIERQSYGYELLQRFQRIYGDMLALTSVARIYNALESLSAGGLIEETPESVQEAALTRQPKHHYRATAEGVRAYEEWLVARASEERRRSSLFARQLAMLEPQAVLEVMDRYEEECLAEADESSPPQTEREVLADRLANHEAQLALGARLSWIKYARRELAAPHDEVEDPREERREK